MSGGISIPIGFPALGFRDLEGGGKRMSTYVINNRIPRFPIKLHYPDRTVRQKRLEDVFQVWLKERIISNLIRRKACSQLYDFSCWMEDKGKLVEISNAEEFLTWCKEIGMEPQTDWGDFLAYAKRRMPDLDWAP